MAALKTKHRIGFSFYLCVKSESKLKPEPELRFLKLFFLINKLEPRANWGFTKSFLSVLVQVTQTTFDLQD
jgi:hypothetical protein